MFALRVHTAQCVAASDTVTDVARVSIPAQEPQCTSTATGNKTRRQKTRYDTIRYDRRD